VTALRIYITSHNINILLLFSDESIIDISHMGHYNKTMLHKY